MNNIDATALEKLREQRATLQERLSLLEQAESDDHTEGALTDSPQSLRDELAQVDRLIDAQDPG